jgi:MinD-like ATPase involved in chromosome partitioning or flagellar assembly
MADESKPGQIITFYSYKGGTGRSMAVANCGCWLVKSFPTRPRGVLIMDWDLEAPGLHRYFAEVTERSDNKDRPGIINYFDALQQRLKNDPALYDRLDDDDSWSVLRDEFPLDDYLVRNVISGVDFIKAGRYDAAYAELISRFNWVDFYNDYGAVFPAFRDLLLHAYDFCLIDSRTGFNDVSGICTMLLPERLVLVFTPNLQSVAGVLDLATRAADYRLASNDPRTLSMFPLPSRIENAEHDLKQTWQKQYQSDFEAVFRSIYKLDACDLTKYFDDVQLPHVSFYSYGETLALLREERSGVLSLSRSYELFFRKLLGFDFPWDSKSTAPVVAAEPPPRAARDPATAPADAPVVFISYAHLDNVPASGSGEGWVSLFQRVLETRLTQLLGERVNVWRDPKLQGNDAFVDVLTHRLMSVDVFIAVITPGYIKSEFCRRELAEFLRQHEGDIEIGGLSRVIPVFKTPAELAATDTYALMRKTVGYRFYETTSDGRLRELGLELGGSDKAFWIAVDDLAYGVVEVLKRRDGRAASAPAADAQSRHVNVYLAETTPDLDAERMIVKRELQQQGYSVLPDRPLPRDLDGLRQAVSADMDRCRLSVHLVGERYGLVAEGANESIVEIQNELAAERTARGGFSRIVWMPRGVAPEDERQRRFVDMLRMSAGLQSGADLLETSLENLKTLLQNKLTSKPLLAPAARHGDGPRSVYLIFSQADAQAVEPIVDYLFGLGLEVLTPLFDGDAQEIAELHRENLISCDAALIYYGNVNELWLRVKLRELKKAPGWGRDRPFTVEQILVAGPDTPEKRRFRTHDAIVTKIFGEFEAQSVQPIVDTVLLGKKIDPSSGIEA